MKTAIGLDLGGSFIKYGRLDQAGRIIRQGQVDSGGEKGRDEVLKRMAGAVAGLLEGAAPGEVAGIGIGTPGLVDNRGSVFLAPNLPEWDNLPLAEIFKKKFRLPVVVENDVNSFTWGEFKFGAGKPFRDIIAITLGTGLGGGVVVNGKLLRGGEYSAVELGHQIINYRGPICGCGKPGCVESYVGAARIAARARRLLKGNPDSPILKLAGGDPKKITPKIISAAYRQGDPVAARVWQETGFYVGVMLANLVNIFNPEAIIIGGGVAQAGEPLFAAIAASIEKHSFPILTTRLKLLPASLGAESGLKAAAALVFYPPE